MAQQQVDPFLDALAAVRGSSTPAVAQPSLPSQAQAPDPFDAALSQVRTAQPSTQPDFRSTNEVDQRGNPVIAFGKEALAGFNPVAINRAIQSAFWHPIETAKGVLGAQDKVRQDAMAAFDKGDYVTGTAKMVDWLIPFLGPRLSEAGDLLQQGETARGLGAATDVGLQLALPTAMKQLPNMRVSPAMRPRNAVAAEAVGFGEQHGIPLDAGTATGRSVIQTVQKRASDSLGGAGIAEDFKIRQADRLATVGEQQAARAHPSAPVSPEQAGTALKQGVRASVADFKAQANQAYDTLRQIEASAPAQTRAVQPGAPVQSMKLAVDVRPVKQAMTQIYQELRREAELVPLQGAKAKTLTTLDRLMNGPDFAPLSVADGALGDLKALARTDDVLKRSVSQGIAAKAVTNLEASVQASAQQAGPAAVKALGDGRRATVGKYQAIEVLEQIADEPVQAFNQAVWRKDAGVERLRAVQKLAPDALPKVGRAFLDDLMATATSEGGFSKAQGLLAKWENLGPQTKLLLFRDPGHILDLDRFFRLAKIIGTNPNPSGTARVLTAFNVAAMPPAYLVSKLLYSKAGVKLLTKGLQIPVGHKAAAATWAAEVSRAVGEMAPSVALPAAADRDATEGPPR